ncbi:MAG: hypothetical protein PHH23_06615 [Paludibacteraceae bacterium]|nr:hypothetical protein [Paludibacteraceae bacterium]
MATKQYSKGEILKMQQELVSLMLKKAGLKKEDVYDTAMRSWVSKNVDLLTPSELKKYKGIVIL